RDPSRPRIPGTRVRAGWWRSSSGAFRSVRWHRSANPRAERPTVGPWPLTKAPAVPCRTTGTNVAKAIASQGLPDAARVTRSVTASGIAEAPPGLPEAHPRPGSGAGVFRLFDASDRALARRADCLNEQEREVSMQTFGYFAALLCAIVASLPSASAQ